LASAARAIVDRHCPQKRSKQQQLWERRNSRREPSQQTHHSFEKVLEVAMKIGVSGASGHLGAATVAQLVQRTAGHELVAITRTPETVSGPAQPRFGDYNRPESLAGAYAGLDRLLIIPTLEPENRAAQNVAAIDAAVSAGVKHIVFMSTAGARQEEEPALGASYWRGEQHLIANAPTWTILRMNYYAEGLVQQAPVALDQGVLTGLAENRVGFVARGDVAAAAAGILIGDGHAGAIYNATGPERLSGAERAAVIAEITGRPLAFVAISEEQLRAGLTQAGLPAAVVNIAISIQTSFAEGAFDIVTGDVERLGRRAPKPLRDVLAGALKSLAVSETSDAT
jgi:NAD(P)H dehydrogenase (quinone)